MGRSDFVYLSVKTSLMGFDTTYGKYIRRQEKKGLLTWAERRLLKYKPLMLPTFDRTENTQRAVIKKYSDICFTVKISFKYETDPYYLLFWEIIWIMKLNYSTKYLNL